MRHPTEGVLRRLVDEPSGVAIADREHAESCPTCRAHLDTARADAALVRDALGTAGTEVDVDAAWQRLTASAPAARPRPVAAGRWNRRLRHPAAAAVAVAAVLTGASAAAATDWLPIFRTEKVAPVRFSTADLVALPDLSAYGRLTVTSQPRVHEVADAATAAKESGLDVPTVSDLPGGIRPGATYQVGSQVSATFTFSTARATAAARAAGKELPTPPPGLDGSAVRMVAGPGVATIWRSSSGLPALVVGRAVAPKAYSSGLPFETVRDYVLSLPGLPAGAAAQLRAFSADGSTLPLPVPAEHATTSSAQVHGQQATVVRTRDHAVAGVVWVEDGVVTAVAGSLDEDEVLAVARALP